MRVAATLAALGAIYLAMLLLGGGALDRQLLVALYAGGYPWLAAAAHGLTELGGFQVLLPAALAATVAAGLRDRAWRAPLAFALAALACRLLVELQKDWVSRLRPDANEHLVAAQSYAFPSGHAANSMIVWLGAALLLAPERRWLAWTAAALSLLIGLTRPMLGVHWPSDVLGGWAFGLLWVLVWLRLSGRRPTGCSPASGSRSPE